MGSMYTFLVALHVYRLLISSTYCLRRRIVLFRNEKQKCKNGVHKHWKRKFQQKMKHPQLNKWTINAACKFVLGWYQSQPIRPVATRMGFTAKQYFE
jgi:hypothetical protein